MKSKGKKYTLLNLIKERPILIPQIQRDYIQYREVNRVKRSREGLINSLVSCLETGKSDNLHFVYGYIKNEVNKSFDQAIECFVPIDGQQRLTTLYLLHLYVSVMANKDREILKDKLIYKTRETTSMFINALYKNASKSVFTGTVSDNIKKSGWYSGAWSKDNSVKSCLKILDLISARTSEITNWDLAYDNLSKISFMCQNIDNLGKPNELYIKMNSRGKQLTPYENFKADICEYLESKKPDYSDTLKENLDGIWLDAAWELIQNNGLDFGYVDIIFKELFHWILTNSQLSNLSEEMLSVNANTKEYCLGDYFTLETDKEKCLKNIHNTFTLIYETYKNDKELFKSVLEEIGIRRNNGKKGLNLAINGWKSRAYLLSITCFANGYKGNDLVADFKKYFRVMRNLIRLSRFDSLKNLKMFDESITKFEGLKGNIYEYLRNKAGEEYLNIPELKENALDTEVLKAKLILKSADWEKVILEAETNQYFEGEIGFVFREIGLNINTIDKANSLIDDFKKVWEIAEKTFTVDNLTTVQRVLFYLADKDDNYPCIVSSYGVDNLLKSFYNYNEIHHDYDMRGFLRKNESLSKKLFGAFKQHNTNDIKDLSDKLINASSITDSFKKAMVTDDSMFEYISRYSRVLYYDGNYYLLNTNTRGSGIGYELYLLASKMNGKITPFEKKQYEKQYVKIKGKEITYDGLFISNGEPYSVQMENLL